MKVVLKNLNDASKQFRLIPSTYATANLGSQTGAIALSDGIVNVCLAPYVKPKISCADASDNITFSNVKGFWKIEVDNVAYGGDSQTMESLFIAISTTTLIDILETSFVNGVYSIKAKDTVDPHRIALIGAPDADGIKPNIGTVDGNVSWFTEGMNSDFAKAFFCINPYVPVIPEINCEGAINQTGVIEVTGPTSLAIGAAGEFIDADTPEDLVLALMDAGYDVEIIPDVVEPSFAFAPTPEVIKLNGLNPEWQHKFLTEDDWLLTNNQQPLYESADGVIEYTTKLNELLPYSWHVNANGQSIIQNQYPFPYTIGLGRTIQDRMVDTSNPTPILRASVTASNGTQVIELNAATLTQMKLATPAVVENGYLFIRALGDVEASAYLALGGVGKFEYLDVDGVTVLESVTLTSKEGRTSEPLVLGTVNLEDNESLIIEFDKGTTLDKFGTFMRFGPEYTDSARKYYSLDQTGDNTAGFGPIPNGDGKVGLYEVRKFTQSIQITPNAAARSDRELYGVGFNISIPGETVNVVSINKDIEYRIAHYSTGTAIYFYLNKVDAAVEPEPEPEVPITSLMIDNTTLPEGTPTDGSSTLMMSATITRNGASEELPVLMPVSSPPFGPGMLTGSLGFLFWIAMLGQSKPAYGDLMQYFSSDAFTDLPNQLALPQIEFHGNPESAVSTLDKIEIKLMPSTDLSAGALDMYASMFGSRYPNGVTITSYGKLAVSDIMAGTMAANVPMLAYQKPSASVEVGFKGFMPDLTSMSLGLPDNPSIVGAQGIDRFAISDDAEIIVNTLPVGSPTNQPVTFGYKMDSSTGAASLLEFDDAGFDPLASARGARISTDKRLIIVTNNEDMSFRIYLRDTVNTSKYVAIHHIPGYTIVNGNDFEFLPNTNLLFTRGFSSGGMKYEFHEYTVDADAKTFSLTTKGNVEVAYEDITVPGYITVKDSTGLYDSIRDKTYYIDATDPNNPVAKLVYTDPTWPTETGGIWPEIQMMSMNVAGEKKFIYFISHGGQCKLVTMGIDPDTHAAINPTITTLPANYRSTIPVFSSIGAFMILAAQGITASQEVYYVTNADNTVTEVQLPYTP